MRREIHNAAPHVIRAPGKQPPPNMPRARPVTPRPARARIAPKGAEAESWEEF